MTKDSKSLLRKFSKDRRLSSNLKLRRKMLVRNKDIYKYYWLIRLYAGSLNLYFKLLKREPIFMFYKSQKDFIQSNKTYNH